MKLHRLGDKKLDKETDIVTWIKDRRILMTSLRASITKEQYKFAKIVSQTS